MSYLKFDKDRLVNLEYSLFREIIRSNRAGSYMSTTLNGCNTRKYHGLLVCPVAAFGGDKHVLLSSLDVTVIQKGEEFDLGIHRYSGGHYNPKGHQYFSDITVNKIPKFKYKLGGAVVSMERLLVENEQQILIKYTLEESNSPVLMRFRPFLAFRGIHHLGQANLFANTRLGKAANGISSRLYSEYPDLFLQISRKNEFIAVPDWYYNFEYLKEMNRGYEYIEDLFVPGYFELPLKKGESIIFSAGTSEANPALLKQKFAAELEKRTERDSFMNTLSVAAGQFILNIENGTDIVAGFHWYDSISRQTFVSLPGLSLALDKPDLYLSVLGTYKKYLKNGMFPDSISGGHYTWHSADASFWYIWAIQQYCKKTGLLNQVWEEFGSSVSEILDHYRKGTWEYIRMDSDCLIIAEKEGAALTWMNSFSENRPVVQREGKAVELNALWYNAICFALELAEKAGAEPFVKKWKNYPKKIGESFRNTFSDSRHEGLADYVKGDFKDWSVRSNMVIAASLDYTPLLRENVKSVFGLAKKQLLTPRGLRTLSPDHIRYHGEISGNPDQREQALHQGTVWPWLIQFFVEGYLKIHKKGGLQFVKNIINGFEEEMSEHCIGTISETYNGTPPYKAKGAVSQAWSVAAVVYAYYKIQEMTE
jgi:predicted glycogen debranching enzyme